ncbi:MAG: twin-arginine translocation signal domain-containing protein, partial [Pseudomonadota bacterium]
MERRDFLKVTGVGMGTLALPLTGNVIAAEQL